MNPMNYFHMLQRREQILVVGAGVLVLLVVLFTFVIDPILARAANLDRRLAVATRQLAELQTPAEGLPAPETDD